MLAEQRQKLTADLTLLKGDLSVYRESIILLQDEIASLVLLREDLENKIKELHISLENIENSIQILTDRIPDLNREADEIGKTIISLNTDKLAAEQRVNILSDEEIRLETSILVLQDAFKDWQQKLDGAQIEYATKIANKEEILKNLNANLLKITQELDEKQRIESSIRDELAVTHRLQDERDKNLRVREAKIEQGESKLIQNANLMNL